MIGVSLIVSSFVIALQTSPPAAEQRRPIDSARLVRVADAAQSAFESFRRSHLPRKDANGSACDARIGRYCYWRGDDDTVEPPPEAPEIKARRDGLVAVLDTLAAAIPGDAWIAGQLVRYLAESDRTDDAVRVSTTCRAERWWCLAIGGYAAHVGGRFADADSLYSLALAAMGDAERCRWLDLSDLLEPDLARRFQSVGCAGREAFVRRVLWLGAPLLSVSGTDLFTEHLARITRGRMAEHSASPDGESWADDQRALTTRYGWPRWYTRTDPAFGSALEPTISGHDAGMPYYFIPSLHAVDSTSQIRADDWRLDDPRAPAGYTPAYARTIHDLPAQIAVFRRGDSARVIAAWDARRDTTLVGRDLDVALVVASGPDDATIRRSAGRSSGVLDETARVDSGLVSVEVLSRADRRAGRMRVGLAPRPAGRITLSDLLLYHGDGAPPTTLDAARDSALATTTLDGVRRVGVFWEAYGIPAIQGTVRYSLVVEEVGIGWVRRAAVRMGLGSGAVATRVQWDESPSVVDGIAARGVQLDLSRLRAGRFHLELTISAPDGQFARSARDIEVRDR